MGCGRKRGVPLELQRGSQGLARVASEKSGLFLSCVGIVRIPLESLPANSAVSRVQSGTQCSSPAATGILGFLSRFNTSVRPCLLLRHGTLLSSRVVKEVSGFRSSSGGEFGLSQDDRQGGQASHPVVRGYLVFHWNQCKGIRTYLELRGNSESFFLAAGSAGFHSRFNW